MSRVPKRLACRASVPEHLGANSVRHQSLQLAEARGERGDEFQSAVLTDTVGYVADLVAHGHYGCAVPDDNDKGLAEALGQLVDDLHFRAAFCARGAQIVENYRIRRCADAIVEACLASVRANGKRVEVA